MAIDLKNYDPALMAGASVSIPGTLAVTGALTASSTVAATGAVTGASASVTGSVTAKSGTAVPATAGAVAAGVPISMNSNGITIECTTDAPTHARPKGSLCINLGGSSSSTRLYVATDAAGTWTNVETAG